VRPPSLGEHPAYVSVVGCYHYSVVARGTLIWAGVHGCHLSERSRMHSEAWLPLPCPDKCRPERCECRKPRV
jgi:hypothetical protein